MQNKIITFFFIALILSAVVLSVIIPDKQYSEAEKRELAQLENVKISEYFSGEFQTNLDKYLSDQFPARDHWITLKTLGDLAIGKREENRIYFAKNGVLIPKFDWADSEKFKSNTKALLKLQEQLKEKNISFSAVNTDSRTDLCR